MMSRRRVRDEESSNLSGIVGTGRVKSDETYALQSPSMSS